MAIVSQARGVRKISEAVLQQGRAMLLTEEDADKLAWDEIPVGTLKVNPTTGVMSVKLEGESSWVPAGIKNDGTICIAKDTRLLQETFEIVTLDNGDDKFTYNIIGSDGTKVKRQSPKTKEGAFVFTLEKGTYKRGRHHLEVVVDGVIHYDETSGLEELSEATFSIKDTLAVGMVVTATYIELSRFGAPYPRVYTNINSNLGVKKVADSNTSTPVGAEEGDFWLDENYTEPPLQTLPWSSITGKPTTLAGYGIPDNFSRTGHLHRLADITDFPTSMAANGGNSATVAGKKPGEAPGNLVCLDDNGQIPSKYLSSDLLTALGLTFIQSVTPSEAKEGTIWYDTTDGKECIKVLKNGKWVTFGAAWQA